MNLITARSQTLNVLLGTLTAPTADVAGGGELVTSVESVPSFPPLSRKRRWDSLNASLDRKLKEGKTTTAYSSILWSDVKDDLPLTACDIEATAIDDTIFETLLNYLQLVNASVKTLEGKEAKRMFYIVPIVVAVCGALPDVEILVEDDLIGNKIRATGHFEMIIKRGAKRICIVEAKKEDMEQGLAQCLVGAEVASELDKLDVVHGIITTYESWHLTTSSNTQITRDTLTLELHRAMPTRASLSILVGKIHTLLSS